jgi:hypothetical protein
MLYAVRGDLNQVAQYTGSGPSLNFQWQTVQVRFLAFHECVHQPGYAVTGVLPNMGTCNNPKTTNPRMTIPNATHS